MEIDLFLLETRCQEELIQLLKPIVEKIPFYDKSEKEIRICCNCNTKNVKGYLEFNTEQKLLFELRLEKNEIVRIFIPIHIRRFGIGSVIIRYVVKKYKEMGGYTELKVRPEGYEKNCNDFRELIENDGKDREITQKQRIEFYIKCGFCINNGNESTLLSVKLDNK